MSIHSVAFVGLLIIPITTVRSLGTGCAVAVCIILVKKITYKKLNEKKKNNHC